MAEIKNVPLLIVDDDHAIRNLLARVAMRAGFAVDTAKDGQEALEMIKQKPYAIAIVDLMMPRLNGYELIQRIATMAPRPTVIVATANNDVAGLDDTLVRRILHKPFDINAVANTLVETAKQVAARKEPADETFLVDTSNVTQIPGKPDQSHHEEVAASGPPDEHQEPPVEAPPGEQAPKVEEPPQER